MAWVDPRNWLKTLSQECRAVDLNPQPLYMQLDDLTAKPCSHQVLIYCRLRNKAFFKTLSTHGYWGILSHGLFVWLLLLPGNCWMTQWFWFLLNVVCVVNIIQVRQKLEANLYLPVSQSCFVRYIRVTDYPISIMAWVDRTKAYWHTDWLHWNIMQIHIFFYKNRLFFR